MDESIDESTSEESITKRLIFENNLGKEGLELESVQAEGSPIYFVKIHAPDEILRRYAEILKLRMPMKLVIDYFFILLPFSINMIAFRLKILLLMLLMFPVWTSYLKLVQTFMILFFKNLYKNEFSVIFSTIDPRYGATTKRHNWCSSWCHIPNL